MLKWVKKIKFKNAKGPPPPWVLFLHKVWTSATCGKQIPYFMDKIKMIKKIVFGTNTYKYECQHDME